MNKEIVITKKDTFVDAIYRLSLDEMRIFNFAIAKSNPFNQDNKSISISINELSQFYKLDNKTAMYKQFNEALNSLFERKVTYTRIDEEYGKVWVTCRLIASKEDNKNGVIGLRFSDEINQLIKCDRDFLEYKLKQTIGITSPNAVRIYEMLLYPLKISSAKTLKKKYSIEEVKQKLGLTEKYPRFCDFRKYVLEVARKQINKHTDIKIDYEVKKEGRTPDRVIFTAKFKLNAERFELEQEEENAVITQSDVPPKQDTEISKKLLNIMKNGFDEI